MIQPDMFIDYQPPAQRQSETSMAAAEQIKPSISYLQSLVLSAFRRAGAAGMTDEEGIADTKIPPSSYRPRRIELWQIHKLIEDTGSKRRTASGRNAAVWCLREFL